MHVLEINEIVKQDLKHVKKIERGLWYNVYRKKSKNEIFFRKAV